VKKEFEHKPKEICGLCNKEIDTGKDTWVALIDFEQQKKKAVKFYHRKCLTDLIQGKGKVIMQNFKDKLSTFTKDIFGTINFNQKDFGTEMKNLSS